MSDCNYRSESEEMGGRSCRDGCVDSPAVPSRRRRRRRNSDGVMCLASFVTAVAVSSPPQLPLVAAMQQPAANKVWTRQPRDRGAKLRGLGWHGSWDEPSTPSGKSGKTSKTSSKTGKAEHDASWWASSSGDLPVSTPRPTPLTTTKRPTPPPTMRSAPVPPPTPRPTTKSPTRQPFSSPTASPTEAGTDRPSIEASHMPSISPTIDETALPSGVPTQYQSATPSISHSSLPSARPSVSASAMPSEVPSAEVGSLGPTPPILGPGEAPSRFDIGSGNSTTAPISDTPAPTVYPSIESNGTLAPTQEDTSDALPLGDVELISPPPLQGLELDLFGLDALDEEGQRQFEKQTAAYIASFYDEDAASDEDDLRSIVSNVTAEVSVIDHRPPEGPTFGFNCADIDPLTVVFSVELTYSSSDSDVETSDVVAYPFSKNRFRQQFLYDYLVADSDELSSVQCVSGVYLPSGTEYPTYAPTAGPEEDGESEAPTLLAQSSSPSRATIELEVTDDIFLDMRIGDDVFGDLRFSEPTANERKCNDKLREVPRNDIDELEVSFVYAVETASGDESFVGDLETLLLDFAAVSLLRCAGGSEAQAAHLWRSRDAEFNGVVTVRYPEFGELTSRSKCEPTSQAKECWVLTSKVLVTSVGTPESEVHREVLVVLANAFRKGTFAEFVPGVVSMSYLGPDPEAVEYLEASEFGGTSGGSGAATIAVAILFSIGCISLLLWAALPTTRILVASKVTSWWGRVKQSASRSNHAAETARRLRDEDNYRERVAPYSDPAAGVVGSYRDTSQTPYPWRREY